MAQFQLDQDADTEGTYKIGAITLVPVRLVDHFGPPTEVDGYKVSGRYSFIDHVGRIYTLYDWKATSLYDDGSAEGEESSSPTPEEKRLGKIGWLGQAFDEGWLQRLELRWDDGELGPLVAGWKEPASTIPLLVRPAPQIGDVGLRQILQLPQLQALELEANVLRNPSAWELGRYPNIVDLTLEFRLVDADTVNTMLAQLSGLVRLRRLHLKGHERLEYGNRPNDADLLSLRHAIALKRLYLSASPAVSDAGIAELSVARPDLIIART